MATGASTAQLAIVLVDARKGCCRNRAVTRISPRCWGFRHVVVAVNKMDLVDSRAEVFADICEEFTRFRQRPRHPAAVFTSRSARWTATTSSSRELAHALVSTVQACCTCWKRCRSKRRRRRGDALPGAVRDSSDRSISAAMPGRSASGRFVAGDAGDGAAVRADVAG